MTFFTTNDIDDYLRLWEKQAGADVPVNPIAADATDIERMIRLMNSAGVTVYAVDAEGLQAEDLGLRSRPNAPIDPEDFISQIPEPDPDFLELAKRTGGRAFVNRNDLETGIRRAVHDSDFSYTLGYVPDHNRWNGEWRRVQVKLDRPGLTVLARSGYFALPASQAAPRKERFEYLRQVAASPIDSTQLSFTCGMVPGSTGKDPAIEVAVYVSGQTLTSMLTSGTDGHIAGHFEIMLMQLDAGNRVLDATQKQIDADVSQDEYARISQRGWRLPVHLGLKTGATQLCVILHDEASDAIGSIHIPLPPYADTQR